ncbi:hypothetical protein [Entomospira culicis]|uniref:Cell division protein FtsQ n=1 Tax=Entomospira culicis TaxID=2719989 RepID=A0A968KZT4_9SPIO|nr:hypothetical protein [Entomospira culicis]NIZ19444.1 hypothetical protein [Entomospira culicis]NIZ69651.1 hypothetical protein [Entomospira culicis]WDI36762.1 hypothetical protein PVA46_05410 [Entomospira culicis]WDI38391.1 hypothetical protein PVA47_05420 [Entomospira culicis]
MSSIKGRVLLFLIVILVLEVIYFGVILPRTLLKTILIDANFDVLESDIYELGDLDYGMRIMEVDPKALVQLLEAQSMIQEAHVQRGHFGRLYIQMKGYNPSVALITAEGGILFLDHGGYLFSSNKKTGIFPPLLHGAQFEQEESGLRLHKSMRPLLTALQRLREHHPTTHSSIAGIKAISKADNLLYWQVSFIGLRAKAKLASYLKAEDIERAFVVLLSLESQGRFLGEVDFRTNEIVYTQEKP